MTQTQSPQNQNGSTPVQNFTLSVGPPPQPKNEQSSFWPVLPSLLWFALAVVLLIVFGKKLGQLLTEFMWRLRSGAAIKIASVELGPIVVASGQEVSQREKEIGVRPDKGKTRENERYAYVGGER